MGVPVHKDATIHMPKKTIEECKKQRLLARTQKRWKDQVANENGVADTIREDRDAR